MATIRVDQSIWAHPKTLMLSEELGVSPAIAAVHMIRLWHWALDYADNGHLCSMTPRVVSLAAGWQWGERQFILGAERAGFINVEDGHHLLHDFCLYNPPAWGRGRGWGSESGIRPSLVPMSSSEGDA